MLKSIVPLLLCPSCKDVQSDLQLEVFQPGDAGHVSEGVLICRNCSCWYPIDRDVLELVPFALLDQIDLNGFIGRHLSRFSALDLNCPDSAATKVGNYSDQVRQREHFDLYAEEAPGFADYTLLPFIRASSARYIKLWRAKLTRPDALLLDIGCGNGMQSYALLDKAILVGLDISRKAVRKATEGARSRGLMSRSTFFVGDGSSLPVVDQSFDYAHTFGVLHHLPNPRETIADIQRVLKPRGIHFAVENNKSAFRGIFDLLMKMWPLWIEEAGSQPTMSRKMIAEWARGLPVRIETETSVFLPPHMLNLLGTIARPVLEWSDRICSHIPGLKHHGGQLVITITKD